MKARTYEQLNMHVNPRVYELLGLLKTDENVKAAMKGKVSNHRLTWYGLSLIARQCKVKVTKKQLSLF